MIMNTCKTCNFWRFTPKEDVDQSKIRRCYCPSIRNAEYGLETIPSDGLTYGYDEGAAFYTGPDFGCIHHKKALFWVTENN